VSEAGGQRIAARFDDEQVFVVLFVVDRPRMR
jgi:hypothetical protein